MMPIVAIIGRANVGKSTLFNRLTEQPKALVSDIAGTTRDRNIDNVLWRGKQFRLVDTGGLDLSSLPTKKYFKKKATNDNEPFEKDIIKQAKLGIEQANLLLFVVDGQTGIQTSDRTIVKMIRQAKKPCLVVVNKIDNRKQTDNVNDFLRLGLGQPLAISANNGSGIGDLLDFIHDNIQATDFTEDQKTIRLTLIGKPNVGKSSLLNTLLGQERVIVSPIPHTTRETHDEAFVYNDQHFTLVDTAGIRKSGAIAGELERAGIKKSLGILRITDVALLVIESHHRLAVQDKKIAQAALESGCALIIIANKWDLVKDKDPTIQNKVEDYLRKDLPFLAWAPIVFVSAKTGEKTGKIFDLVVEVAKHREQKIGDKGLENVLKQAIKRHWPTQAKGVIHPRLYELRQVGVRPPRFDLIIHPKAEVNRSYMQFIERVIREKYDFTGTPISINQRMYKK